MIVILTRYDLLSRAENKCLPEPEDFIGVLPDREHGMMNIDTSLDGSRDLVMFRDGDKTVIFFPGSEDVEFK